MADLLFFWLSKIVWLVISPDIVLVILTLGGIVLLFFNAQKKAKIVLGFAGLCMIAIAVFPIGQWLLSPMEKRFPTNPELPDKVDGVIVLAGAEDTYKSAMWNQVELGSAAERIFTFMQLMKRYPDAVHLFTGGTGRLTRQDYKSTDVVRQLFQDLGLDVSKILFEADSRNTYESGKYSRELIKPKAGENWVLITTAFHMPRSVGVFEKQGWSVIPYPVDHYTLPDNGFDLSLNFLGNLGDLKMAVREWVGLMAYYATGKTSAFFPPAPERE